MPYLWSLDRVMIPVAVGGAFVRMGNLFNHEIYGHPTDRPWGFRFIENVNAWMNGRRTGVRAAQPSDADI